MDVRAADRHAPNLQENVPLANLRNRYFSQLHGVGLEGIVDDRRMGLHVRQGEIITPPENSRSGQLRRPTAWPC
jgi:hypothetical protein